MKKGEEHLNEKLRVVLIGVVTSVRDHDVATIRFALCPNGSLLFDLFECILCPVCEQERHGQSRSHCFFSRTSMPIPLVSIAHPSKALAAARRSNCSCV